MVYLHSNTTTGEIFYVGIGRGKRPWCFHRRNPIWKRYVAKHGLPLVRIFAQALPRSHAEEIEKILIQYHGRKKDGGTLTNITFGGEQNPMDLPEVREKHRDVMIKVMPAVNERLRQDEEKYHRILAALHSPESKSKAAAAKQTRDFRLWFAQNNPMYNDQAKSKIRARMLGHVFSAETTAKMSESAKARGMSAGVRMSLKNRMAAGWNPMNTEEARTKVSAKLKGCKRSREHCRKNGEAHSKPVVQLSITGEVIAFHRSYREAAVYVGCTGSLIGMCVSGAALTGKGFLWRACCPIQSVLAAGGVAGVARSADEASALLAQPLVPPLPAE